MSMAYLMLYCDVEDDDVTVRLGLHNTNFFVSTLNGEAYVALDGIVRAHGEAIPYGDVEVSFDFNTLDAGAVEPGTKFHLSYQGETFYSGTVVKRDAKIYP